VLTLDDVRALPPDELAGLPLALIPCHRLLVSAHAIDPLWRALDEGRPGEPAAGPEVLLVWRQELELHHRAIDPEEHHLLALAAAGTTLPRLCEEVTAPTTDEAAQRVFPILARWLGDGLLLRR
jgi:hypothetical protein